MLEITFETLKVTATQLELDLPEMKFKKLSACFFVVLSVLLINSNFF